MRVLVTGGCGFIGSNFVINSLKNKKYQILNIDSLTYAANLKNLEQYVNHEMYSFVKADICNLKQVSDIFEDFKPDVLINFAAESHVDNSINSPDIFINTNILGTHNLLKASNEYWNKLDNGKRNSFRFFHISTDEVFGSLNILDEPFHEDSKYSPNSPYSASKAASDHLVRCYNHTYGLPTLITNCSNNYGPYQNKEKLIPKVIHNVLNKIDIPIYGNGKQIRDWLHVDDHVEAINLVLHKGSVGQTYNIGGNSEKTNIDVVSTICMLLDDLAPNIGNKNSSYSELIKFVDDRPGHDTRYAINPSKIKRNLGWEPAKTFEAGIKETVLWYLNNKEWL